MKLTQIRKTLNQQHNHIWQLCQKLGVSRDTFYRWYHVGFKNHKSDINNALKKLKGSN